MLAWGLLSREVAARLEISIKTVETHEANAMGKMGLNRRIDLVRYDASSGQATRELKSALPPEKPHDHSSFSRYLPLSASVTTRSSPLVWDRRKSLLRGRHG